MEANQSTIKMYNTYLNRLKGVDFTDANKTLEFIDTMKNKKDESITPSYKKGLISAILYLLKQNGAGDDVMMPYHYKILKLRNGLEQEERNHVIKSKCKIPQFGDILKKRDDEIKKGHYLNHLILSLYTFVPPRRVLDYALLKIVEGEQDDESFNYYDTLHKKFIFNVYKTSKKYHRQVFDVPKKLHDIIIDYAIRNNLCDGDLLLNMNASQLSARIKQLLGCGVDNLRHSFVNNVYDKFDVPSNDYMESLASKMGHSLETHLRYRK